MYAIGNLPNDDNVRNAMIEKDVESIIKFFDKCKQVKSIRGWEEMKITCLCGLMHCYCTFDEDVIDEIRKTRAQMNNTDKETI